MWRYGLKIAFWVLAMVAIGGLLVMSLWNWLIPELFNGNMIDYWQALGLMVLARLLTGLGRGGGHWQRKWQKGWLGLSDAERETLRAKFKDRWCQSEPENN